MTKLEKKLIELGYKQDKTCVTLYYKEAENGNLLGYFLKIFLKDNNKNIRSKIIDFGSHNQYFEIIDRLCKEMEKDLEILKECEE